MPPKKEAWWVCSCGAKINRVKKSDPGHVKWFAHVAVCLTKALGKSTGMQIKQLPQTKEIKSP